MKVSSFKITMALPFKKDAFGNDALALSPEGIPHKILDCNKVDFSAAAMGRKAVPTLVRRAEAGELIITKNAQGLRDASKDYVTTGGELIIDNGNGDIFVPAGKDGTRARFAELEKTYDIVGDDYVRGGLLVVGKDTFPILPQVITEPTCIKDAFGPGNDQWLPAGSTLKLNTPSTSVTGFDPGGAEKWEVTAPPQQKKGAPDLQNRFKM